MKKAALLILLGITMFSLKAQVETQKTIYYDKSWKECAQEDAQYTRTCHKHDSVWEVTDMYKNGNIQMSGTYADDSLKVKYGHFIYRYEDGKISSEGNYVNDKSEGTWQYWHNNGKIKGESFFDKGKEIGTSKWYFDNGQMSAEEIYDNGKFVKGTFWDSDGKRNKKIKVPEQMPEYKGGQNGLMKYLVKSLRYPADARENGIEGRVVLQFIIGTDGSVTDCVIVKKIYPSLDEEALRVVKSMTQWKPGFQHSIPVSVRYTLPIVFRLN
jgi:TonB family protein